MISKRHHYVPRFYLNYFVSDPAVKAPTFWVYKKGTGPPRRQTPQNTAVQGHFYSFEAASGQWDDSVERALAKLESAVKPILDRWQLPTARPTKIERFRVAGFLAFMHTRIPRTVASIKEIAEWVLIERTKTLAKSPEKIRELIGEIAGLSFEEIQELLSEPEKWLRFEVYDHYALGHSLRKTLILVPWLLRRNWCLCDAPKDSFFITSDAPVISFTRRRHSIFAAVFGSGTPAMAFAISPRLCLLIGRYRGSRRNVTKSFVDEINQSVASQAESLIIASQEREEVAKCIREFGFTNPRPQVDRTFLNEAYKVMMEAGLEWLKTTPADKVDPAELQRVIKQAGLKMLTKD